MSQSPSQLKKPSNQNSQLKKKLRAIRQSEPLLSDNFFDTFQKNHNIQNRKPSFSNHQAKNSYQEDFFSIINSPKDKKQNPFSKKQPYYEQLKKADTSKFGSQLQNIQTYKEQMLHFKTLNLTHALSPSKDAKQSVKQVKQMVNKHDQIMNKINQIKNLYKMNSPKSNQTYKKQPRFSQPAQRYLSPQNHIIKPLKQQEQNSSKNNNTKNPNSLNSFQEKMKKIQEQLQKSKNNLQDTVSTQSSQRKVKLQISDFIVLRQIGKGKFGVVSVVIHKKTGAIFAMKAIKKDVIQQEGLPSQLLRQIKIQFFINHVHIVKLYGIFDDQNNVYLITEYCSEGQLFKKLQAKTRLLQGEASNLIKDICQGAAQLHSHGVIHRDLKPQNIVLNFNMAKICDFGWSVAGGKKMRQTFCGTPLYVSPQLLVGKKYDEKVDLWAIGIITFELIVGDIPFKITNQKQLIKIVHSSIQFPQFISEQAKSFINCLLAKNPAQRSGIKQLLQHQFIVKNNSNSTKKVLNTLAKSKSSQCLPQHKKTIELQKKNK